MIDWHCHILPDIDDGSKSVSESTAMLQLLSHQGVDTVIATPHFYADHNSVEKFLEKREKAYKALTGELSDELPEVLMGAEVCYYPGISKLSGLKDLCIEGTNLLLLEMPMARWTEYTLNEVRELAFSGEFTIIIAHIDRYLKYQNDGVIKEMCQSGIYMQMNSGFLLNLLSRRKAFKLLRSGVVSFIGSDCHNITSRKPTIGEAFIYIRRKFGDDYLNLINDFGYSMIN